MSEFSPKQDPVPKKNDPQSMVLWAAKFSDGLLMTSVMSWWVMRVAEYAAHSGLLL